MELKISNTAGTVCLELILLCLEMILAHGDKGRRIRMQGNTARTREQTISLDQDQETVTTTESRNERDVGSVSLGNNAEPRTKKSYSNTNEDDTMVDLSLNISVGPIPLRSRGSP